MTELLLSIIVPCKNKADPILASFLESIRHQDMPPDSYEVLVMTEGNSEQAKAIGIQRAKGKILGLFCSDNYLRHKSFLRYMVEYALKPGVTGAYTAQYDYVPGDKLLSRYCALLGVNDPLCWWLKKADRQSYLNSPQYGVSSFPVSIPSLGDNGFFIKRSAVSRIKVHPDTHFPMDFCEDLRKAGEYTYCVTPAKLWHRTGESWRDYLRRRYVYTRDLYFKQKSKRRWHMVDHQDWPRVWLFGLASLVVLPHLWVSLRGYSRLRDWAWFLHPFVCLALTLLYTTCFIRWDLRFPLLSRRSTDLVPCASVSKV